MSTKVASLLHIQIQDHLRKGIESGEFGPGTQLPTEKEIMIEFGVSRGTVIRAVRELENQGVLWRKRGAGTFVSKPAVAQDNSGTISRRHIARFLPMTLDSVASGHLQDQINRGLASICGQHQAIVSLHCVPVGPESFESRLMSVCDQIISHNPRSVVFTPLELPPSEMGMNVRVTDRFSKAGVPVILLDRDICEYPARSKYTWVGFDNRRACAQLTLHVLDRGYKNVVFIGTSNASTAAWDRLVGYLDALRLRNVVPNEKNIHLIPALPDESVCDRVLAGKPGAIICKDSFIATLFGEMLTRRGVRLGTDIGLAGFDLHMKADLLPASLTFVQQPTMPVVQAILRAALSNDGELQSGEHIQIQAELVIQQSTCGPGKPLQ